jgi:hypothetical protein
MHQQKDLSNFSDSNTTTLQRHAIVAHLDMEDDKDDYNIDQDDDSPSYALESRKGIQQKYLEKVHGKLR